MKRLLVVVVVLVGLAGFAGVSGALGATASGPTGAVGPSGSSGPSGDYGPSGGVGPSGDYGPSGGYGPSGDYGPTGVYTIYGATGGTGPTGATGADCPATYMCASGVVELKAVERHTHRGPGRIMQASHPASDGPTKGAAGPIPLFASNASSKTRGIPGTWWFVIGALTALALIAAPRVVRHRADR